MIACKPVTFSIVESYSGTLDRSAECTAQAAAYEQRTMRIKKTV